VNLARPRNPDYSGHDPISIFAALPSR